MVEMAMFNVQRVITPNVAKQSYGSCVLYIMVLYICVKFHENISNGIRVMWVCVCVGVCVCVRGGGGGGGPHHFLWHGIKIRSGLGILIYSA